MKKHLILFLLPVLILYNCSLYEEKEQNQRENIPFHSENYIPGIVRLKVTEAYAQVLELEKDLFFPDLDVSVVRTFPYCGKFEARTRKAGLHLWYDVTFDSNIPLTKAGKDLTTIEGIEIIAYLPKIKFNSTTNEASFPFSDPLLPLQWHYQNDGTLSGSVPGADINVYEAWKYYTTGSKEVIVAVVDGGVAYNHEDLANNMWINWAEREGESGIDDDNNGYIDDVYGFNFINGTGHITPEDHGTHVAGTIGAVNNNHTGVGGIAGGDGVNKGVLIMSCQVLDANDKWGDSAQAIKYAADNGAVICQNSWSYREYTEATKVYIEAAIDYFNQYAGLDENGVQTGPMAGGLVVFAAGNDNKDTGYPASYEGVMAVAAIKNNFERASYSNYGSWVDIAAPGGQGSSDFPTGMVYSTLINNQYGYKMGTSMACPHVSGVAALVVSHFGGPGFTRTILWDALVNNSKNINAYNTQYKNLLGTGLVDSYAALASFSTLAPEPVHKIQADVHANHITLSWQVPKDEDDGKAYGYIVYGHNTSEPEESFSLTAYTERFHEPGDTVSVQIRELAFSTSYSFAIQAFDYAQNMSDISESVQATTGQNSTPVITPLGNTTITLKAHESGTLSFKITEPDDHSFTCSLDPGSDAATLTMRNDTTAVVNIYGPAAREGTYTGVLTAVDFYGLSSSIDFTYTLLKNNPPVTIATMENIYFGSIGGTARLAVNDYFYDPDEEPLTYTFSTSTSNAEVTLENDLLYIIGKRHGYCTITVTATDALGESCSTEVLVLVRDGKQQVDLYPNPVLDVLYIRTGEPVRADITITSSVGARILEETFEITPFSPAQIDMTAVSAGVYTVHIRMGEKESTKTIIKL